MFAGRTREALAEFRIRGAESGSAELSDVGIAKAEHTLGHPAESQRALDVLIKNRANVWAYQIAQVYAWRGQSDKAFEWLERAYRQRDGGMIYLGYDRYLVKLRGDPRYRGLLKKLKLPE